MVKQIHPLFPLLLLAAIMLGACASPPTIEDPVVISKTDDPLSLEILALVDAIEQGQLDVVTELARFHQQASTSNHYSLLAYANAKRHLALDNEENAYLALNNRFSQHHLMLAASDTQNRVTLLNARILEARGQLLTAIRLRVFLAPLLDDEHAYQDNHLKIWNLLSHLDTLSIDLSVFQQEQVLTQWLTLSRLTQDPGLSLEEQLFAIERWQMQYPDHPASLMPPPIIGKMYEALMLRPQQIAVILPLDGRYRSHGIAIRDGIMQAYYQSGHKSQILFYAFDEMDGFLDIYHEAIYDGAELVIGPLFKNQLEELYTFPVLPVPTIALNRLDGEQTGIRPHNLYEFSLAIDDEIDSIIRLATHEQHHNAIIIHQKDDWAIRAAERFNTQWRQQGRQILDQTGFERSQGQSAIVQRALNIDSSNQRNRELQWLTGLSVEHEPRRRQDIDMILLLARQEAATSIRPLLAFHYAGDVPIYANSSVYRGYPRPSVDGDLNGIRFTDIPLVINPQPQIGINNPYAESAMIRMYAFGIDAFRLTERIQLMAQMPQAAMYGATGRLSIEQNNVRRQTAYAQFRRGRIVPIILTPGETEVWP